jgi:hypothetical protein
MATISIPAKTQINVVATTFDHSAKSNLGPIRTGSYLSQASMLVYDDILRYQRGVKYTHGLTAEKVDDFNYNQFEGNVLWFMDELVGMESDWIKTASASSTTAYAYVQFTEDSVETAVNRYIGHLERFNERKDVDRGWLPYSIKKSETLPIPEWLTTLKNSTKTHKEKLNILTYDEMLALAFVHLHSKKSKDANFVLLAKGDIYASKEIYKNNHHTNPDAATLTRLEGFFPWRKQNIYVEKLAHAVSSVPTIDWMYKSCPGDANQTMTPDDVINCLKSKLTMHSGDELFSAMQKEATFLNGIFPGYLTLTDETANIPTADLGAYSSYDSNLTNKPLSTGSSYKVIKRKVVTGLITPGKATAYSYYFYRTGDLHNEWLQNIKTELSDPATAHHYNCDELCQTIGTWGVSGHHTYIVDWFNTDIADANYLSPPYSPLSLVAGFSWNNKNINKTGLIVIGISINDIRKQFGTVIHEAGGHAGHPLEWGGEHTTAMGNAKLLTTQQNIDLNALYKNYKTLHTGPNHDYLGGTFANLFPAGFAVGNLAILQAQKAWLEKYLWNLPMTYIVGLESTKYNEGNIEDEFLARVYATMATNKCITFTDDIWPIMKEVSPSLAGIIDINLAREIDTEMREKMLLNKRTYNTGRLTYHS